MTVGADQNANPDLEQYRSYLKLLADLQLNPHLKVKEDASDIVQQTMLEAHRDFKGFRGKTESELRAWLTSILTNNLVSVARHYHRDKRAADREVSLQEQLEQSSALLHRQLVAEQTSPSMKLEKQERLEQLANALLKLLDGEREAVVLKHYHNWTVAEIARHLGRTEEAVAGLLRRGLKKLRDIFWNETILANFFPVSQYRAFQKQELSPMSAEDSITDEREQQLDAIIAAYYRAVEAGECIDQRDFIAKYPEVQKELSEFFADLGMFHAAGPQDQHDPALEPTITAATSHGRNQESPEQVRYFGAYEILEELGSGGMGVVYKARHLRLKKLVALKMIRAGAFASELEVKMFQAEVRAVAKLDHSGIVAVHEVGMHAGQHFYAMDYVSGGSLSVLLRDEPVASGRAAELVKQLADAVHYAHGEGIVHRDLKPANILLTPKGEPRISDFGLAKRMWIGEDSIALNMTETGKILGTPGYMSPEQAEGKSNLVTAPADVYALGAVLYALLTSRAPFVGESHAQIIQQVTSNEPVSPRMLNPNVSSDLETICLKCLSKEPHDRYGTAQLLAEDLQRFLDGKPVLARPISRLAKGWKWCRRNPAIATLAIALLLTLSLSSLVSASFGITAGKERDAAVLAKENELAAKKQAQKDRDEANAARVFAQEKEQEARANLYTSRLYALVPLWQQNEWGELGRLMKEWEPTQGESDFRGWEWHYLQDQLRQQVQRLPGNVKHAVWSPDGKYLAAAGENLLLYDAATLTEIKSLGKSGGHFVTWSNDSTHLALLSNDVTYVFNAEIETAVQTIKSTGTAASWSPDHSRLAIVGNFDTKTTNLKIWTTAGTLERTMELGVNLHTWSVDWHPTDDRVLVGHRSEFSIWEASSGNRLAQEWSLGDPAWTVKWSPDGKSFLVGGGGRNRVWKLQDGRVTCTNSVTGRGHSDHATAGCWSSDGNFFASGGRDFSLLVFSANSHQFCSKCRLHSSPINRLSWHPDGRLVSCDEDGASMIYRPTIGADHLVPNDSNAVHVSTASSEAASALPVPTRVTHTQWSHHGDRLATFCPDGTVRVWSTTSRELLTTLRVNEPSTIESVGLCAWSPDDQQIVVADLTGCLSFFKSTESLPRMKVTGFARDKLQVPYWTADGKAVVASRADGVVVKIDPGTGTEIPGFQWGRLSKTDSSDGRHIIRVVSHQSGVIEVVDTASMARRTISINQLFRDYALHPNGRNIGFATQNGIILLDLLTNKPSQVIKGGLSNFCSLAWSPDGNRLAVGTTAGQVDILDAHSYIRLITLKRPESSAADYSVQIANDDRLQRWITSLDWSLDGRRLVSAGERVLIWGSEAMPTGKSDRNESSQAAIRHAALDVERLISTAVLQRQGIIETEEQTIQKIAQLPTGRFRIRSLTLDSPLPLSEELCNSLSRLGYKWRLDASNSGIDLTQLNLLRGANGLSELAVARCQIDDDAIATLAAARQLKLLDIRDTLISAKGSSELRRHLSNAEIHWNAREADRAISRRLLAKNARVSVKVGQQRLDLHSSSDLPDIPFRVVSIKAEEKPGLTAGDFEGVEKLDALESVDLLHTHVDDAVLEKFQALTNLHWIGFGDTRATGRCLANFDTLPKVSGVCFGGGFSNDSVEHFDKFPGMKEAYIGWTSLDDRALGKLPSLPELAVLVCDHTQIQGSGFQSLSRFPKLHYLNFTSTLVDDEGLRNLPVLPSLLDLRLSKTLITDASVPHLSRLTTLNSLELLESSVSSAGLAELRNSLPGCRIEWSPAPVRTTPIANPPITLAELEAAVAAKPDGVEPRLQRGRWYRMRGLWKEATADHQQALQAAVNAFQWDRANLAALHLRQGNNEAYQKLCSELLAEMEMMPSDGHRLHALRAIALHSNSINHKDSIFEPSQSLLASPEHAVVAERIHIGVLCRTQRWKETIEAATVFRKKNTGGIATLDAMLFEAIAQHRSNDQVTARNLLLEAKSRAEAFVPNQHDPIDWYATDALFTEVLFAQASKEILGEEQGLSLKYPSTE